MKSLKNISYGSEEFDTIRTQNLDELKNILLENFVDEDGDLNISNLDFSDFNGDVYIPHMKVKGDLFQDNQQVKGNLWQHKQKVEGDLYQYNQSVKGNLYSHELEEDEYWKKEDGYVLRAKKLKEITKEELEKMGYKLKVE